MGEWTDAGDWHISPCLLRFIKERQGVWVVVGLLHFAVQLITQNLTPRVCVALAERSICELLYFYSQEQVLGLLHVCWFTDYLTTAFQLSMGDIRSCRWEDNINIKNSEALVRKRTLSTERPPLVGEVSANFSWWGCHVVSSTKPHGR
jgi:hypothetical protein